MPRVEVCITDELHLAVLPEVGAVFDRILSLHPHEVVIDLSECRHLDAAAIGLLLDVHRRLARHRAVLTVRDPNPRIRRILQTARVGCNLAIISTSPRAGASPAGAAGTPAPTAHGRARVTAANQPVV